MRFPSWEGNNVPIYTNESKEFDNEDAEPQFLPTITTDGMVNIKIENKNGVHDHFLYVEDLRAMLILRSNSFD